MKTCTACKQTDVVFGKNKSRPDGLQTVCISCKKITNANAYKKDAKKQYQRVKNRRKATRQFLFDYLKSNACVDCGESDPIVLQFDHLLSKKMNLSDVVSAGWSLIKIGEEIGKCEVRCANCHARKTAEQFGWYKDLI